MSEVMDQSSFYPLTLNASLSGRYHHPEGGHSLTIDAPGHWAVASVVVRTTDEDQDNPALVNLAERLVASYNACHGLSTKGLKARLCGSLSDEIPSLIHGGLAATQEAIADYLPPVGSTIEWFGKRVGYWVRSRVIGLDGTEIVLEHCEDQPYMTGRFETLKHKHLKFRPVLAPDERARRETVDYAAAVIEHGHELGELTGGENLKGLLEYLCGAGLLRKPMSREAARDILSLVFHDVPVTVKHRTALLNALGF